METHTGKCLCGDVTYSVTGDPVRQGHCHCLDCKKATGAGFATIAFFKDEQFAKNSGQTHSYQHQAESGNTLTKEFCQRCGSLVFGSNTGRPGIKSVYVGSLDDAGFVQPQFNVWMKRLLSFYRVDETLNNFEEGAK